MNFCKRGFRIGWRYFKWLFVLTLPLTALTILTGIVDGLHFSLWKDAQIVSNSDMWLRELKEIESDWGIGEMTFRDYQDKTNDFHVLRVNSNDWASKLGFIQPQEYKTDLNTPIDKYVDLDTLMFDTKSSCRPHPPKEQWVYISDYAMPILSEWDAAFEAAVQASHVPSALNQTRLFYAKCHDTAGFMCGIWGVKEPALVHFLIEDTAPDLEDIEPGLSYSARFSDLRPVTARVIEFPLTDEYTALPSSVFPGPTEQMLAMMRGDKLYEQFEPWNEFAQSMCRFLEYLRKEIYLSKGTFMYYLGNADDWFNKTVLKPSGLYEASELLHAINFFTTYAVFNVLALRPWIWAKQLCLDFLGYPKPGDFGFEDDLNEEWNIWDA